MPTKKVPSKRTSGSPASSKYKTMTIRILVLAAIVLMAIYAAGIFDNGGLIYVDKLEYSAGGFDYTGNLLDGKFSGYGMIDFWDGGTYSGGFADGRFSGEAVYSQGGDEDDSRWGFTGVFHDGQTGNGAFNFGNGPAITYNRDQYADTFISPVWRYNGRYNERGQNAAGTFTFEDGSVYAGGFLDGSASGEGVLFDSQGNTVYTGSFREGSFNGRGVYYSPEGWTYQGQFEDGLFEGEGEVIIQDSTIRGIWERGVQTEHHEQD